MSDLEFRQSEGSYRRGVQQAFAMFGDWLRSHPAVDPLEALMAAEDIAEEFRHDYDHKHGRYMDELCERVAKRLNVT